MFRKLPPPGFGSPVDLVELVRTKDRSEYILGHGFTRSDIKPEWWADEGIEIRFPSQSDNGLRLTRGDLFAMGESLRQDSDDDMLNFVWHVLAWGSGDSRRNNRKRVNSCKVDVASGEDSLLRRAFASARDGNPRAAYSSLIRPGGAVIEQFGPAFFSKFLYFASEGSSPRCLILDARVARSLYGRGWSMAPTYPDEKFTYNWYTDTYVGYCDLLARWTQKAGHGITPDMFERALFDAIGRNSTTSRT
jgi:hypothetical protein